MKSWITTGCILILILQVFEVIAQLTYTSLLDCEANVAKSDLRRWSSILGETPNSKFLYPKDWTKYNGNKVKRSVQEKFCKDLGLLLPSAYHRQDWLALQEIGRAFVTFAETPATKIDWKTSPNGFFTGNFFKYSTHIWNPVSVFTNTRTKEKIEKPFILWGKDTKFHPLKDDLVKLIHYDICQIVVGELAGKIYISEFSVEESFKTTIIRPVCMYPVNSPCFLESQEEIDYVNDPLRKNPIQYLGVVATYEFWVGIIPEYEDDVDEKCQTLAAKNLGERKKFSFDGFLKGALAPLLNLNILEMLSQDFLSNVLKIDPRGSFFAKNGSINSCRWKDLKSKDELEYGTIGKGQQLYFCWIRKRFEDKTKCQGELSPSLIQFKDKSKFVYNKDWTLVLNRNEQEKQCNDEGLILPTAYHIKDWLTLQDLGRLYVKEYADKNGFDWKDKDSKYNRPFFTGNKFKYDSTTRPITEKWRTSQAHPTIGTDPYIIWDPQFPQTETNPAVIDSMGYVNNIRLFDYEGKAYISEGNVETNPKTGVEFEPSGLPYEGGGMIVCQYPVSSPCFTESYEEFDYANDPWLGDYFRYMGQTTDYIWWIGVRPRSYLDQAKADCASIRESTKTGLTGFFIGEYQTTPPAATTDLSKEIVMDELKKLQSITARFLKNIDIHPEPIFLGMNGVNQWHWILDPSDPSKSKPVPLRQQSHPSYWHKYICLTEFKTSCPTP